MDNEQSHNVIQVKVIVIDFVHISFITGFRLPQEVRLQLSPFGHCCSLKHIICNAIINTLNKYRSR